MEKPEKNKCRWTKQEESYLLLHWDTASLVEIGEKLKRSPAAVHSKALELGIRAARRDGMSLRQFSRYSGYAPSKIYAAAKLLKIQLRHAFTFDKKNPERRCRTMNISPEVQERLLERMEEGRCPSDLKSERGIAGVWGTGKKPSCCKVCKTKERPHKAAGMCGACHSRQYKRKKRPKLSAELERALDIAEGAPIQGR